jgi:hypothetical protein
VSGVGRGQWWIGLGGHIDGLGGHIDGLFIFSNLFTEGGKQVPPLMLD